MLVLGVGVATPSMAAEKLTVRFGPVQQTVAIADLEKFAASGEVIEAIAHSRGAAGA
jgi:hypothetical protein